MSSKSNDQGRAYEFACLTTLLEEVGKIRPVRVEKNSSYYATENAWNILNSDTKNLYKMSSVAAVIKILELEPCILESCDDELELLIQADQKGEEGDVRDILIIRNSIHWEIGLSIKHNHFAVKHSRLSKSLDFGKKWYNIPCSQDYWNDIEPVFTYLENEKKKNKSFSELEDKENDVYIPLLQAFIDEINRQHQQSADVPAKLVEYLLGKHDFYKVISIDKKGISQIQAYNLHGTLNKAGKNTQAIIDIPIVMLPSRIVNLDFVPNSANTIELYMDGGWQFTFRIHNASTKVETSLKFDIQIVGMPTTLIIINCEWMLNQ